MIDLEKVQSVFFIGIGGIGMSALARHLHAHGKKISGFDKTPTGLTKELEKAGINITYEDSLETIPPHVDLVVYTPAIPKDHKQLHYFLQNDFIVMKRSELL